MDRLRWLIIGSAVQTVVWGVKQWRVPRGNCLRALIWWWRDGGALIIQRSESTAWVFHLAWARKLHPAQRIKHVQPEHRVFGPGALLRIFLHKMIVIEETVAQRDVRIEHERLSG